MSQSNIIIVFLRLIITLFSTHNSWKNKSQSNNCYFYFNIENLIKKIYNIISDIILSIDNIIFGTILYNVLYIYQKYYCYQ